MIFYTKYLCRTGCVSQFLSALASLLPGLLLLACSDTTVAPAQTAQATTGDAAPVAVAEDRSAATEIQDPAVQSSAQTAGNNTELGPDPQAAEQSTANMPIDASDIYNTYCAICHKSGLNAAPKYGNKILWARALAKGQKKVYENALNGVRGMPAKGGFAHLSEEEVIAATDYMVNGSGGWK